MPTLRIDRPGKSVTGIPGERVTVFALMIVALVTLYAAFYWHGAVTRDVAGLRQVKLFVSVPRPSLAKIEEHLLATPLHPDLLHGLVAHRVIQRASTKLEPQEREALESLGWQSTLIQMDLLQDGIARKDEDAVLTRIDGLLRRGKQKQPLLSILFKLEQSGAYARGKLIEMLAARPQWRRDMLTAPEGMAGIDAVMARAETLDLMHAKGLSPLRPEVAPIVNGLAAMQDEARAESLWRKFHGIGRNAPLPFDDHFAVMAADPRDGQYQSMMFEWRASEGSGFSARASTVSGNSAILNLRWDGRGAPTLLQQKLVTLPGRFAVAVRGSLLDRSVLQRFAFVFYCHEKSPVFHDRLTQGAKGEFVFVANESVMCRNPEMRLVGISEEVMSPIELEIASIRVRRIIPVRDGNLTDGS